MENLKNLYNSLFLKFIYHDDNIYRALWEYNETEIILYLREIKAFKEKYGQCTYPKAKKIIKKG